MTTTEYWVNHLARRDQVHQGALSFHTRKPNLDEYILSECNLACQLLVHGDYKEHHEIIFAFLILDNEHF